MDQPVLTNLFKFQGGATLSSSSSKHQASGKQQAHAKRRKSDICHCGLVSVKRVIKLNWFHQLVEPNPWGAVLAKIRVTKLVESSW